MPEKQVKIPGPDHPVTIAPNPHRVIIWIGGRIVADSRHALTLSEAGYAPVEYLPRSDAEMTMFERSDHSTWCPYKGDCSYFHIPLGGDRAKNAIWSYETPLDAVAMIREHLAFYPDRVDRIEQL